MDALTPPTGYGGYARLATSAPVNTPDNLREAAAQFESMFIDMWLSSARKANQVFAQNNPLNTSEMQTHQEMLDHEMAKHLASNGGIGLADTIVAQLSGLQTPSARPSPPVHTIQPVGQAEFVTQKTGGQRTSAFDNPAAFVEALEPIVNQVTRAFGLPPLAVLAQAALETGWGRQVISSADGELTHNLFGMKATSADEEAVSITSKEFSLGRWLEQSSPFRAYPNWQASVTDYAQVITQSSRYQEAIEVAEDPALFLQALQDAGYATDPRYAHKIGLIMEQIQTQFKGIGL